MVFLAFGIYIFLDLFSFIIFLDVIFSFLPILGIKFRPKFISSLLDPIYKLIKNNITTVFGPFDFIALIILMIIYFLQGLLIMIFPGILNYINFYSRLF